jgi:ATP-binding cassette subfamily F protein uup
MAEGDGRWMEYAGGYSDMVAQRGAGVSAAPILTASGKSKAPQGEKSRVEQAKAAPKAAKARLSFHEKHALDTLPKRIKELSELKAKLQRALDDPQLFARDPDKFSALSQAFAKTEAELAGAEDEWLALEIRREEISG